MQGVLRLMAFAAASGSLIAVAGCHDRNSQDKNVTTDEATSSVGRDESRAGKISAQAAIQRVKRLAENGKLNATVHQSYTETRTERTICGEAELVYDRNTFPQDPERWLCKSPTGRMPYYKYATIEATKCCHTKQVKLPADVLWDASRSPDDGNWLVTGSFKIAGLPQIASWVVDAQTGEVR